jgi:hypothetical protein
MSRQLRALLSKDRVPLAENTPPTLKSLFRVHHVHALPDPSDLILSKAMEMYIAKD